MTSFWQDITFIVTCVIFIINELINQRGEIFIKRKLNKIEKVVFRFFHMFCNMSLRNLLIAWVANIYTSDHENYSVFKRNKDNRNLIMKKEITKI